jgi:hypothetical protein
LPALATARLATGSDTVGIGGFTSAIVSVRDTTVDGRALWRIAHESRYTNTVTVNRATLRPVDERYTDYAGNTVAAHYDGPHLALTLSGASEPMTTRDTVLAVAPYSAQELDILLKCMPLAKGYSTRLPVYDAQSVANNLDWITILVTGIDSAQHAWVVDVAGTGAIGFSRRWIARPES